MTTLKTYQSISDFYKLAMPYLMQDECGRNLVISILSRVHAQADHYGDSSKIFMTAAFDRQELCGVFLRTPPYKLLLESSHGEALRQLAASLSQADLPGVIGEKSSVEIFAAAYQEFSGKKLGHQMAQRAFQLTKVNWPAKAAGQIRLATASEAHILEPFVQGFIDDCKLDPAVHKATETLNRILASGKLYVWEEDGIKSVAGLNRETPNGSNIGLVYTPPEFRGKGYASTCVATLSQMILDSGKKFSFLMTDLANPTSNKIYQNIGYHPLKDYLEVDFV